MRLEAVSDGPTFFTVLVKLPVVTWLGYPLTDCVFSQSCVLQLAIHSLDSEAFLLRHTQVNNGCGKMVSNSIRADRHGSIVRTIDPADTQKYFHESAFLIRVGKIERKCRK